MGKGKKQSPNELIFLKGLLLSFGIYLLGQLLVTLLVVKGALAEEGMFPAVAALCLLSLWREGHSARTGLSGDHCPAPCCVRYCLQASWRW